MHNLRKRLLPFLMLLSLAAGLCGCGIDVTYADGAAAAAPSQASAEPVTASPSPSADPSASPSDRPTLGRSSPTRREDDLSASLRRPLPPTRRTARSRRAVTMRKPRRFRPAVRRPHRLLPAVRASKLVAYVGQSSSIFSFNPVFAYPERFDGDAKQKGSIRTWSLSANTIRCSRASTTTAISSST